jgi:hypothetical protein
VVDNINVRPDDWRMALLDDGRLDHYYFDVDLPELDDYLIDNGLYYTYWKYEESQRWVQEGEGAVMYKSFVDEKGKTVYYSESITCDYSLGKMRINFRTSDFWDVKPSETLTFRFVVLW